MSLRTDYTGALDTKLAESRAAGRTLVLTTEFAAITTEMAAAAAAGIKEFTITVGATFQSADLRLETALWEAHRTGILQGLAEEDLMGNEVTVELNTQDQTTTRIDMNFKF